MTDKPTASVDLKKADFPFIVECFTTGTGELRWKEVISEPGVMHIAPEGEPVDIKITWPSGEVTWARHKRKEEPHEDPDA
jgi:hypothetical protein